MQDERIQAKNRIYYPPILLAQRPIYMKAEMNREFHHIDRRWNRIECRPWLTTWAGDRNDKSPSPSRLRPAHSELLPFPNQNAYPVHFHRKTTITICRESLASGCPPPTPDASHQHQSWNPRHSTGRQDPERILPSNILNEPTEMTGWGKDFFFFFFENQNIKIYQNNLIS